MKFGRDRRAAPRRPRSWTCRPVPAAFELVVQSALSPGSGGAPSLRVPATDMCNAAQGATAIRASGVQTTTAGSAAWASSFAGGSSTCKFFSCGLLYPHFGRRGPTAMGLPSLGPGCYDRGEHERFAGISVGNRARPRVPPASKRGRVHRKLQYRQRRTNLKLKRQPQPMSYPPPQPPSYTQPWPPSYPPPQPPSYPPPQPMGYTQLQPLSYPPLQPPSYQQPTTRSRAPPGQPSTPRQATQPLSSRALSSTAAPICTLPPPACYLCGEHGHTVFDCREYCERTRAGEFLDSLFQG